MQLCLSTLYARVTLNTLFSFILFVLFSFTALHAIAADFVGSANCKSCHQTEYQQWLGSDHDMAMRHAEPDAVLGNFDNANFDFNGKTNRFFMKDQQYWVNIEGSDGEFHDYQISYTFGFYPLQQYMVKFPDGRVQLIPFAWDSRPKQDGGQRWYHLYPEQDNTDEFFWTNSGQNWNYMCADCHSTQLKKNYDAQANRYDSTWSEINVGCEACHGGGSEHISWAKDKVKNALPHAGFDASLGKAVIAWEPKTSKHTLQPSKLVATKQTEVCAQCHSRRIQLNEDKNHLSTHVYDKYMVSLITPELYHDDGQIFDEDYVYGSFLQSKMHQKGVVCSNCHNPHSTKLVMPREVLCNQCHIAENYTSQNHSFHAADKPGGQCVDCHMPETTYMQVDDRRDHSWPIPRPDLSKNIGTPNVCTQCHNDKSDQWAIDTLATWFPSSPYQGQQHFGVAFYAADTGYQAAGDALSYITQDIKQSEIIRASALQRLNRYPGQNSIVALARAIKNDNPMLRLGVVQGSAPYPFNDRWQILAPLLQDPILSVRTETASALARYWSQMSSEQRTALQPALDEYITIQKFNADRGFGRTNLGNVYRALGKLPQAIVEYQGAIAIEPIYANSYVALAETYRAQHNEALAVQTLAQGLEHQPKSALLHYSSALAQIRANQKPTAAKHLKRATELEPQNPQYWYVYGLALESVNLQQASQALVEAYKLSNNPEHLYARCDLLSRHQSIELGACLRELSKVAPKEVVDRLR